MQPIITSSTNPKIKWVKSLHKNSTRRAEGVFLVEGAKEIAAALDSGYLPHCMFVCPEIFGEKDLRSLSLDLSEVYTVSKEVFEKIAYRSSSDGLLAVFRTKERKLEELNFSDNPLFLIVEAIEKPGNLGAIIRTADGAGVDGVIVCDQKTDLFNPNVIRSSVGTLFSTQVVAADSGAIFDFLEKHEISAFGAVLSDESRLYTQADLTGPTAIVLGTEHEGLSDFWKQRAQPIIVPMRGQNDSLNVSNAAAILAYEAVRQRHDYTELAWNRPGQTE